MNFIGSIVPMTLQGLINGGGGRLMNALLTTSFEHRYKEVSFL